MERRYRDLPLNPLRAFAVASQHKTFTSAARYMGVSQVAISRQISTLEDYLGVKLFVRGARSVKLTEVGRSFGQEVSVLFEQLEQSTHAVLSDESENTIKLRIYPTFAQHWLLPRLGEFQALYPDYRLRLDTTVEALDFRGTHLDVAIQLGHGSWRDSKCRKLFDETVDVVCSPGYAQDRNWFAGARDLATAELLHAKYRRKEWEIWAAEAKVEIDHLSGQEFDSSLLVYSAAQHGFGLALGQVALLARELKAEQLIRPFRKPVVTGAGFHVIWPTTKSVSTKTRNFIDWLLETSGETREFFKRSRGVAKAPRG
jgi:LysR family glycine cleavage system transcriptional activator